MREVKILNIEEFKALVKRYKTITLKEIKDYKPKHNLDYRDINVACHLTGFGSYQYCTLCKAAKRQRKASRNVTTKYICNQCIYFTIYPHSNGCCNAAPLQSTFTMIEMSDTPEQLLQAYRARAKVLEKVFSEYFVK